MSNFFTKHPMGIFAKVLMCLLHDEHKITYSEAVDVVLELVPELFAEYNRFMGKETTMKNFVTQIMYKRVYQCYYSNDSKKKIGSKSVEHPKNSKLKPFMDQISEVADIINSCKVKPRPAQWVNLMACSDFDGLRDLWKKQKSLNKALERNIPVKQNLINMMVSKIDLL
jgi:hypothetical protein